MQSFGAEKAIVIRQPATANLMISSYDDPNRLSAGSIAINKGQALLNGFFTRIAATEVAINWQYKNIYDTDLSNNWFRIDVSGVGIQYFEIPPGSYNCAEYLDTVAAKISQSSGGGRTMAVSAAGQYITMTMTGGSWRIPLSPGPGFLTEFAFPAGGAYTTSLTTEINPLQAGGAYEAISPIIYLDFVSPQLTYNQDLKDSSTAVIERDVLCRWYMNYDNDAEQVDKYGFPIRMGMKQFYVVRKFNPPKQIKWDNNQPIGQLTFQVYATYLDGTTTALFDEENWEWLMTLQLSEN